MDMMTTDTDTLTTEQIDADVLREYSSLSEGDIAALTADPSATPGADTSATDGGDPDVGDAASNPDEPGSAPGVAHDNDKQGDDGVPANEPPQSDPVILAKDGKNTIPYSELQSAREEARASALRAAELERLLQQAQTVTQPPGNGTKDPDPAEESPAEDGVKLFGDFSDEEIAKGTAKLLSMVQKEVQKVVAPLQQQLHAGEAQTHIQTILAAHPDAADVGKSEAMQQWIASQPSFAQRAIESVLANGSAKEVVEVLDSFKAATTAANVQKPKDDTKPDPKPEAAAATALEQLKPKPPNSLSDLPAGATPAADPVAAMLDKTPSELQATFEGMTPEQIEQFMRKTL